MGNKAKDFIKKLQNQSPTIFGKMDDKLLNELKDKKVKSEIWIPKIFGDSIIGTLINASAEKSGKYKSKNAQLVLNLKTADGKTKVYCNFSIVNGLQEYSPSIGDVIAIQFRENAKMKSGKPAKLYAVVCKGKLKGYPEMQKIIEENYNN